MAGTEATIRALLRYLHGDMNTLLSIPSVGYADHSHENLDKAAYIHAFSDASHGPYRFNGRRSYTSACREIHKHPCKRWGVASRQILLAKNETEANKWSWIGLGDPNFTSLQV